MEAIDNKVIKINNESDKSYGYWQYSYGLKKFHFCSSASSIVGHDHTTIYSLIELTDYVLPDFQEDFNNFWENVFNKRRSDEVEIMFRVESKIKWLVIRALVNEEEGLIHGFIQDISREKENEHINNFKINLSSKIERIANTASFEWDLGEEFLVCSDNFFSLCQMEGHNDNNKLSKGLFFSLIDKSEQNFVLDVIHENITFNREFEISFHTSNSTKKKLKMYGYPYGDIKSKKLLAVVVDVTNEMQHEESIIRGQDTERKRISLELHDSVGQKLIAVKYMLALSKMTQDFSKFQELNDTMDKIIEEIRTITHNLSSRIVTEIGLENSIAQLLNECTKAIKSSEKFIFDIPESLQLSDDMTKMIYRIVQEALSNAMKYSSANEISLSIKYQNKQIIINIIDNGVGFDVSQQTKAGIGLQNIRQRVSFLNGFFKIDSKVSVGTHLKVKIPVKNQ
ncbi:MAG: sensor histidine kinase [Bacteroidota bacterium]